MLIGSRTGSLLARASIHAESLQVYREVYTTDAVAGGISATAASGSAFSRHTPSGPQIAYLYRVPSVTPGTNSSHTPDPPSERIGYARPSQPLKSDRKSTRLNSSHPSISYAVFCLKKKN